MKSYSTATDATNFNLIHPVLKEWVGETGAKNLGVFVKQGRVDVELPKFDHRDDRWDGTLLVHFKDQFTPAEVINYIVAFGRADEISFENDKTLRMWWD
jgi:hypothetical protein